MKKIKKEEISQEIFDLYDEYVHNKLDRRHFVERLSVYAIGGLTVPAILDSLLPNYRDKIRVVNNDPRLDTTFINYQSPDGGGQIRGQLSKLKASKRKQPGVIVIHENRGLNPHIEDVGRRVALEGFLSLAPDALTPLGGYPGTDDEGRTLQKQRDKNEMLEDFIAAYNYLKNHPDCTGKIGVVGFCFGGWVSNMMAVKLPELGAAVPFYGGQAPSDNVPDINAPLLLHFAENDPRVNEGWPAYEAALIENKKDFTAYFYPGTNHGFHNDTTPRFDADAASLAWKRTIDFFNENLI